MEHVPYSCHKSNQGGTNATGPISDSANAGRSNEQSTVHGTAEGDDSSATQSDICTAGGSSAFCCADDTVVEG